MILDFVSTNWTSYFVLLAVSVPDRSPFSSDRFFCSASIYWVGDPGWASWDVIMCLSGFFLAPKPRTYSVDIVASTWSRCASLHVTSRSERKCGSPVVSHLPLSLVTRLSFLSDGLPEQSSSISVQKPLIVCTRYLSIVPHSPTCGIWSERSQADVDFAGQIYSRLFFQNYIGSCTWVLLWFRVVVSKRNVCIGSACLFSRLSCL